MDSSPIIRPAGPADEPTLWLMLTWAASMGAGGSAEVPTAQADPYLSRYVQGWATRPGDLGVIAQDDRAGPVGAAWLRYMPHDSEHAGGNRAVPELATAVVPERRGRGIGRQMLDALLTSAADHVDTIRLSVREENPAACLYRSLGFVETGRLINRVGGVSLVMERNLRPATQGP